MWLRLTVHIAAFLVTVASAAQAMDIGQQFLIDSDLEDLAESNQDLNDIKKEFVSAISLVEAKVPEYVQRSVRLWLKAEARNFKNDLDKYASNEFCVRDNCRKLYNLTSHFLSMSNRRFPTESDWNRSVDTLSRLQKEFQSQVAARKSIPPAIADRLNVAFSSWITALTDNPLSPICFLDADTQLVANLKMRATNLIDSIAVYSRQLEEDDQRFVDNACGDSYLAMIESVKSRLPKAIRSQDQINFEARMKPIVSRYSEGYSQALTRDFADRNALQRARMDAESTPEAVAAEIARHRELQKKKSARRAK